MIIVLALALALFGCILVCVSLTNIFEYENPILAGVCMFGAITGVVLVVGGFVVTVVTIVGPPKPSTFQTVQ